MSVEAKNKSLLRRYVEEVWEKENLEALGSFLSSGYRRHVSGNAYPLTANGQAALLAGFREAFPDARLTLEEVVAEGDKLCFRSTVRATHRGSFRDVPPTNRPVVIKLIDIVRVENGKFAEQWGGPDLLDLLHQLGARVSTGSDDRP